MTIAERTIQPDGPGAPAVATVPQSAVVWINGRRAIVARMSEAGRVSTARIERGLEPEPTFLARVVHAIGDRERVVILGPTSTRLLLEREYVAIHQRPDHLIDVEDAAAIDEGALIERLREVAEAPESTSAF